MLQGCEEICDLGLQLRDWVIPGDPKTYPV